MRLVLLCIVSLSSSWSTENANLIKGDGKQFEKMIVLRQLDWKIPQEENVSLTLGLM